MSLSDDWERQRAFLAVIREGSLSGAARTLELAQPTVRRRVEELEAELRTPLFTRAPSGLIPTERGLMLREHAEAMAMAADAFMRSASAGADEVAGTVRISASDVVAVEILPPILAALREAHPRLVIALSPTNRNEDVLRREADIAVRMVRPKQEALVARWVGSIPLGLHARRDYLARHPLGTIDEIGDHALIGVESDTPVLRAIQDQGFAIGLEDFGFRSDNDLAQLAAIRAGLGIGFCQVPLAARDPELVRVFPDAIQYDLDTWVVAHEDQRGVARIRTVFVALVDGLSNYIGRSPMQRPAPANWS
jgi:DNA-binding transcriptional LysR family regulator